MVVVVSIPVLVNLRLGASPRHAEAAVLSGASQFLFW